FLNFGFPHLNSSGQQRRRMAEVPAKRGARRAERPSSARQAGPRTRPPRQGPWPSRSAALRFYAVAFQIAQAAVRQSINPAVNSKLLLALPGGSHNRRLADGSHLGVHVKLADAVDACLV